jgi:hypothetical protein
MIEYCELISHDAGLKSRLFGLVNTVSSLYEKAAAAHKKYEKPLILP